MNDASTVEEDVDDANFGDHRFDGCCVEHIKLVGDYLLAFRLKLSDLHLVDVNCMDRCP